MNISIRIVSSFLYVFISLYLYVCFCAAYYNICVINDDADDDDNSTVFHSTVSKSKITKSNQHIKHHVSQANQWCEMARLGRVRVTTVHRQCQIVRLLYSLFR